MAHNVHCIDTYRFDIGWSNFAAIIFFSDRFNTIGLRLLLDFSHFVVMVSIFEIVNRFLELLLLVLLGRCK